MKNLLLFALFSFLMTNIYSQKKNKITFVKVDKIKLEVRQQKILTAKKMGFYELKGNFALANKGYAFYQARIKGKGRLILVLGPEDKSPNEITIEPNFSIVSEGKDLMVYCSCGNNINRTHGDSCQHYATSRGTQCAGGCGGEQDGKSCTFTSFNILTGEIAEVQTAY